jgi:hypothetical protein
MSTSGGVGGSAGEVGGSDDIVVRVLFGLL